MSHPPDLRRRPIDTTRLWSGGLATAVVAALIGLVGVLIVRAVFRVALHAPAGLLTAAAAVLPFLAGGPSRRAEPGHR